VRAVRAAAAARRCMDLGVLVGLVRAVTGMGTGPGGLGVHHRALPVGRVLMVTFYLNGDLCQLEKRKLSRAT